MIIGVINQKGGVGKTTLAINIADHLARARKEKVLLVDADPQASSLEWSRSRETTPAFNVIAMATDKLWRDMPKMSEDYDHVIIDGPPRVNALGRSAILASDFVLVPVLPSALDLRATVQTVELIEEARGLMQDPDAMKAAFVINQRRPNTVVAREAAEALGQFGYPSIPTPVTQRVAFAESIAQGTTVTEDAPDGVAAQEITSLVNGIIELWSEQ